MMTALIAFGVFLLIIALMSVGVVCANRPIKGSCGGLSALGLKEDCLICGGGKTSSKSDSAVNDALFYNAMRAPGGEQKSAAIPVKESV